MFGYVRYDFPNLYVKDVMLYKALYCGLCKAIGSSCGQASRIGLSYDMTFFSALLHNMTGTDVEIEEQNCFEHAIRKRPIAKVDPLTEQLGALNTILVYYKLTDDISDGGTGRGKRIWFKRGFKKAKEKYPKLVQIVERYIREQAQVEKQWVASCDIAADPSARLFKFLADYFLGEKTSEKARGLFWALGKWIYLIDALDDLEKDVKAKNYNPFYAEYLVPVKKDLLDRYKPQIEFMFNNLFRIMRENLAGVTFYFNRDLTDNVILRGLPLETARVMKGEAPIKMSVKI